MKGSARVMAEGLIERHIEGILLDELYDLDEEMVLHDRAGDFLIEVKAHYLGSRTKRLVG